MIPCPALTAQLTNHHAPSLSTYPHAASASCPRFADATNASGSSPNEPNSAPLSSPAAVQYSRSASVPVASPAEDAPWFSRRVARDRPRGPGLDSHLELLRRSAWSVAVDCRGRRSLVDWFFLAPKPGDPRFVCLGFTATGVLTRSSSYDPPYRPHVPEPAGPRFESRAEPTRGPRRFSDDSIAAAYIR